MLSRRRAILFALLLPVLLAASTSAAWAIDTSGDVTVRRGVEVMGRDLGGQRRSQVRAFLRTLDRQLAAVPVTVSGTTTYRTTAGALGLSVDRARTEAVIFRTGRQDPGVLAPIRWAKALLAGRPLEVRLQLDQAAGAAELMRLEGDRRTLPVEPSLRYENKELVVVPGQPGGGIDIAQTLQQLPGTLLTIPKEFTLQSRRSETQPQVTDAQANQLANEAIRVTSRPIKLVVGSETTSFDPAKLRPAIRLSVDASGARLGLDQDTAGKVLNSAIATPANPTKVTFRLDGTRMVPVPGQDATICCDATAVEQLSRALFAGDTTITLPATTTTAAEGATAAQSWPVQEVIGEFTTNHPAGQPRVINIHRIADLIRGQVIMPGETFSINEFVGERTADKGFVEAPVIDEGKFSTDIGGGVSQFATTLFNAAFFGGLDIPEHKAHSIYISRYPFGREATLAYPAVDLKVRNNTPYPVVIWDSYTSTSLTVQLWSTRYATGSQTGANKTSGCGAVTIERTRLFVDGHTDKQTYRASYSCNPPEH